MATPRKYQPRATPLPRGARNKVNPASRLARRGLVMQGGVLYSKRTGMAVGPNRAQAANPQSQKSGFDPGQAIKDFFGQVAPQDNLFKQIGTRIKNPSGK